MKIDIRRIDELITLGHIQIAVDLLFLARKKLQSGGTITFQTISDEEDTKTHGQVRTVARFDDWVLNREIFKTENIAEKLKSKNTI